MFLIFYLFPNIFLALNKDTHRLWYKNRKKQKNASFYQYTTKEGNR